MQAPLTDREMSVLLNHSANLVTSTLISSRSTISDDWEGPRGLTSSIGRLCASPVAVLIYSCYFGARLPPQNCRRPMPAVCRVGRIPENRCRFTLHDPRLRWRISNGELRRSVVAL